jgi:MoCo/4Fe-4S cofactor protein with predicted Tat translocation signal
MTGPVPPDLAALAGAEVTGPRLWRSLEERAGAPDVRAFLEAEFPEAFRAAAIDRRAMMRLMSASLALAGLGACGASPPSGAPLLSRARNTPGTTRGVPLTFATSLELDGVGCGVLVKAQEGRPIKIEGNPLHPASLGATDVFAQAEILSLYDPDRSRIPTENGAARSWQDVEQVMRPLRNEFVVDEGKGLHVLVPPLASPTLDRMMQSAGSAFPNAVWHRYAPLRDDRAQAGAATAFGRPLDAIYDLTQADAILTLGGDLLGEAAGHVRYAADLAARRRVRGRPLPRLFCAESTPSLMGARADKRLALPPRAIESFARAVAAVIEGGSGTGDAALIAAALSAAGTRALVAVGREQPAVVHALAHRINARLGAIGTTVRLIEPVIAPIPAEQSIEGLAEAIVGERVRALLILGGNPVYDAPADLDFGALVRRVPWSLHLGFHRDETARACHWHLPQRHPLEGWGDLRAFDGTAGLRQPATMPLVPSVTVEETVATLAGLALEGAALVQMAWREEWGDDFDARWLRALEDGVVAGTAAAPVAVTFQEAPLPLSAAAPRGLALVFAPDPALWDGRYANNGWLQELPKPLTKQTWGNAALLAPDTATALGVRDGDEVEIASGARRVVGPASIVAGHAPDTVTLTLGYGRTGAGRLAEGVGFDAYALRTTASRWLAETVVITPTGKRRPVITTQMHHAMEGRDIVRVVATESPEPVEAATERPSLYPDWPSEGHAWGMAIDLDACIGCNACVVACQAENNVPVVGPEEVARGREMHWLRVDRYYAGAPSNPRTYFQPVPCMHCENAPCEVVCPVNATVHSSEGLNDMVYNRCIGTRTCSNNCPYKVRRFNFLDYQSTPFATSFEAANPQVTVRDRGVMEKCTYCVQRISAARGAAGLAERPIRDGDVVTACAQACPTQAIAFGDVNDPDSAVSGRKRDPRNYALLGALNTRPRTTYLARIELPADAAAAKPGREG